MIGSSFLFIIRSSFFEINCRRRKNILKKGPVHPGTLPSTIHSKKKYSQYFIIDKFLILKRKFRNVHNVYIKTWQRRSKTRIATPHRESVATVTLSPKKTPPLSRCMRTCACIRRGALGLRGEDLSNDQSHFQEFISNSNTFQKIYKIVFLIQIPKHSLLLKSAFKKFVTSKKKFYGKEKHPLSMTWGLCQAKRCKRSRGLHIYSPTLEKEKKNRVFGLHTHIRAYTTQTTPKRRVVRQTLRFSNNISHWDA